MCNRAAFAAELTATGNEMTHGRWHVSRLMDFHKYRKDEKMFHKSARIVLLGSLLVAPLYASAMSGSQYPFPTDGGGDHRIEVAMPGSENPFPTGGTGDHRIEVSMTGSESPFPSDGGSGEYRIEVAMPGSENPFPTGGSGDHRIEVSMTGSESPFPTEGTGDHRVEMAA